MLFAEFSQISHGENLGCLTAWRRHKDRMYRLAPLIGWNAYYRALGHSRILGYGRFNLGQVSAQKRKGGTYACKAQFSAFPLSAELMPHNLMPGWLTLVQHRVSTSVNSSIAQLLTIGYSMAGLEPNGDVEIVQSTYQ